MHSDLCWEAEEEGRVQRVPVPVLRARESWTGSAPQNPLQVKDFACREKPSCTDMWLEQVSTAGLSTVGFVHMPFTPLQEWDILIL